MNNKENLIENLLQEQKRGTLVFSVLLNTSKACYGYALVQTLQESGVDIEQNTLYPLLRRLEKQELLTSSWDTSESRPRKYYTISKKGKDILKTLKSEWLKMSEVINRMIVKEDSR